MMDSNHSEIFDIFPWNKNFETGIPLIDEQHKKLVNLLNKLAAHLADRACEVTLSQIFKELADYASYHFKSEEEIWQTYFNSDIWFINHQQSHHSFSLKIAALRTEEHDKQLDDVLTDVLMFLTHWLAYHILDTDKRMAKVVLGLQEGLSLNQAQSRADSEMSGSMKLLIDTILNMYDSLSSRTLELMREKAERQRIEEALKASEERWRFVLEGAGDGIWDWDIGKGEVYYSASRLPNLGFLDENAEGSSASQIHPDDMLRVKNDLQAHFNGISDVFVNEHRLLHQDGQWSWVLTRGKVVHRDISGKPLRMIGTHIDITERELAAMVFQNSREAIIVTDTNNTIVSVNKAFCAITGYEHHEAIGKNPSFLASGRHEKEFYHEMWNAIKTTGSWQGEVWNRRKSGELYPEWLAISAILNSDGSVHHYIALFSDISDRKLSEETIWRQANFDTLTGLANRHMLHDRLQQEIKKTQRSHSQMALMFIDLDFFKLVNDSLGHFGGDILLKEVARRLLNCVRSTDTVARLGGDEFTVMLTDLTAYYHFEEKVAQKLLTALEEPFYLQGETVYLSASIGITLCPDDGCEVTELLKNADQAMYHAKKQGRNRFSYFARFMQEAAQIRIRLANDLRRALLNNQFVLHYQPIVDMTSGMIYKAEALLRWMHPEHGMVSPATFIPIAEEIGLIVEIGDWVFCEAVRQVSLWRDSYCRNFQVSVNKSPIQFRNDRNQPHTDWVEYLKEKGVSGKAVVLEITEGSLMEVNEDTTQQLLKLRDAGVQVALDDFGTGFSSLSYLYKLDIDYIKIDQSFVRNLSESSSELVLCEAITAMAHKLGLKVIAEGIETTQQAELLKQIGCDYGQGYLFSRPVLPEKIESLLEQDVAV